MAPTYQETVYVIRHDRPDENAPATGYVGTDGPAGIAMRFAPSLGSPVLFAAAKTRPWRSTGMQRQPRTGAVSSSSRMIRAIATTLGR